MKGKKKHSLKGSSLIEVIVALSLVSIIFVIGSGVWAKIDSYQSPDRLLRYRLRAKQLIDQCKVERDLGELNLEQDGIVYRREVLSRGQDVFEVRLRCYTPAEQLLFERSKILHWHEN